MSNSRAIASLAFWGASLVSAQVTSLPSQFPGQTQGDFIIKAFRFNSGEVLPELRLHYVTFGTPHRDSSGEIDNAVLLLHSTGRGPLKGGSTNSVASLLRIRPAFRCHEVLRDNS
jgi:hypothetical protein